MKDQGIDITPTPRILRTLGEIPFLPWQCLAELIDNAVDALTKADRQGVVLPSHEVIVSWSADNVGADERVVEVSDTGPGMDLSQIQDCVRAGYSNNDPLTNLGLFGMGFNIATARLGDRTRLLSTKPGMDKWVGVEVDFSELIRTRSFLAPVVSVPKSDPTVQGTRVVVSRLRAGGYANLRDQEGQIRRQLEDIYTPLLGDTDVDIFVQGKKLSPQPHCVWAASRYVVRDAVKVPAKIEIDRDLGVSLFDMDRNAYLTMGEEAQWRDEQRQGHALPPNIVERHKRLRGWVGIQRYNDVNDFGIDFVRNGRKILIRNKSLFSCVNPLTGTEFLEYPLELGSTVGGRIVGEVHVDYLLPTYQKNDFDRTDPSWRETVEALRGVGPILPTKRKALGLDTAVDAPVAKLVNAYRRQDPGIRCLAIDPRKAREWAANFRKGEPAYASDDKWWHAAKAADKDRADKGAGNAAEVDEGAQPTDNADDYGPSPDAAGGGSGSPGGTPTAGGAGPTNTASAQTPTAGAGSAATNTLDDLMSRSTKSILLSGPYSYSRTPQFEARVWEISAGQILSVGERLACAFFKEGNECDFFYDPRHPFFTQFQVGPRELLALYLSERFKARDSVNDLGQVFMGIVQSRFQDTRIDRSGLQDRAAGIFTSLRERMVTLLASREADVLAVIHESSGEVEETVHGLLGDGDLLVKFQAQTPGGIAALANVPNKTLMRIVDRFPEELFDGKFFKAPCLDINLADQMATERARGEAKDRVLSFMKDALWVLSENRGAAKLGRMKDELVRCSHSIRFLEEGITS